MLHDEVDNGTTIEIVAIRPMPHSEVTVYKLLQSEPSSILKEEYLVHWLF